MKSTWKQGLSMGLVLSAAMLFAGCEAEVEDEGEMPDVNVDAQSGELPEVDVQGPDVEVEQETVEVPTLDVETPDEQEQQR